MPRLNLKRQASVPHVFPEVTVPSLEQLLLPVNVMLVTSVKEDQLLPDLTQELELESRHSVPLLWDLSALREDTVKSVLTNKATARVVTITPTLVERPSWIAKNVSLDTIVLEKVYPLPMAYVRLVTGASLLHQ